MQVVCFFLCGFWQVLSQAVGLFHLGYQIWGLELFITFTDSLVHVNVSCFAGLSLISDTSNLCLFLAILASGYSVLLI